MAFVRAHGASSFTSSGRPYRAAGGAGAETAETSFRPAKAATAAVAAVARALWPSKTDMQLAFRTGATDRAARNWLALRFGISGDDLVRLIASDDGFEFLEATIEATGAPLPAWWGPFKRAALREHLRARIDRGRASIDQLELKF